MSTSNTEDIKHPCLRCKHCTPSNCSHLDGRHRACHQQVFPIIHTKMNISINDNVLTGEEKKKGMTHASIRVIQFELSTFCAGSWPVARNRAVRKLAACALKPPIDPAIAVPTKFFLLFRLTKSATVVLRIDRTTLPGTIASATTLFPRPSIQLIGAGFLSVQ